MDMVMDIALAMVTVIQATLVTDTLLDPMYMFLTIAFTSVMLIPNPKLTLPLSQKLKLAMGITMAMVTQVTDMVSVTQDHSVTAVHILPTHPMPVAPTQEATPMYL